MKGEFFHKRKQEFAGFGLEEHYLGPKINWDSIYAKHGLREKGKELNLKQWVELFKKAYPLDPQSPKKKWSKDIFDFTAKELGLDIEEPEGLSFYNATGSGLDFRGIDCFFVFKNPKTKKEAFVTIDLTKEEKKDEWKADFVLHEFPDYRPESGQYDQYIEEMEKRTEEIAEKLKNKTEIVH